MSREGFAPRGPRGAVVRPRKRFGQHFLTDRRILERIADAALGSSSRVVEIGPGRGALTDVLADRAAALVAVEIDRDLAAALRARYAGREHVQIVEGDAMRIEWSSLLGTPYSLVGNIPYNITTPILFKSLDPPLPERAVFLVQREVAERSTARPGSKDYGALTVNVQVACAVEMVGRVPAGAFQPRPKVDSAIIRLTPRETLPIDLGNRGEFRQFVQAIFGMRRKQLIRSVREVARLSPAEATEILDACGVPPTDRAENLSPSQFVELFHRTMRR